MMLINVVKSKIFFTIFYTNTKIPNENRIRVTMNNS